MNTPTPQSEQWMADAAKEYLKPVHKTQSFAFKTATGILTAIIAKHHASAGSDPAQDVAQMLDEVGLFRAKDVGAMEPMQRLKRLIDVFFEQQKDYAKTINDLSDLSTRVRALEHALEQCVSTLTDSRIGTWSYMESSEIYDDFNKATEAARAALSPGRLAG